MTDREDLVASVRHVVRQELLPLTARIGKLEDAINGNGREGIREEIAGIKKGCKLRHGSGPPPQPQQTRPEQESIAEIIIEHEKTRRRVPWSVLGIVLAALITSGATVWGASAAAAAQVRAMQQR